MGEYERRKAERYNASDGTLNLLDGYSCPKCHNRGDFMVVTEVNGIWSETQCLCECMNVRHSLKRLENSGLKSAAKAYKFDNYTTDEPWQRDTMDKALRFAALDDDAWFFIGGAVGSGKTHICTAIAMEMMKRYPVKYALWPDECSRLKAEQFDDDEYGSRMWRLKSVELLYLDDFFKITTDKDGNITPPTPSDVRIAHELLNRRYIANLPTIISSERYLTEIVDIDEAIGGRIAERAAGFITNIKRDRSRDYRLKLAGMIV